MNDDLTREPDPADAPEHVPTEEQAAEPEDHADADLAPVPEGDAPSGADPEANEFDVADEPDEAYDEEGDETEDSVDNEDDGDSEVDENEADDEDEDLVPNEA